MPRPLVRWPEVRLGIALMVSIWLHWLFISDVNAWRLVAPAERFQSLGAATDVGGQPLRANIVERAPIVPPASPLLQAATPAPALPVAHAALAGKQAGTDAQPAQPNASHDARAEPKSEGSSKTSSKNSPTPFLSPREVDVRAYPVNPPDVQKFKDQFYGDQSVRLRVWVDVNGHVDHAEALIQTDATPEFVSTMIQSISRTQFAPATIHGQPVDSYFDVDLSIVQSHAPYVEGKP